MNDPIRESLRAEVAPFSKQTAFFWADGDQLMAAVMDRYDLYARRSGMPDQAWKREDQAAGRRVARLVAARNIRKEWMPAYWDFNRRVRNQYPKERSI